MQLKTGDSINLTITNLGSNGEGVGNFGDYVVFVPYALVGEDVVVRLSYVKKNICYGDLCAVKNPSKNRVEPPCPYYGICGGCQLQHMDYATQLTFKRQLVENNLAKIAGIFTQPCDQKSLVDEMETVPNSPSICIANTSSSPKIFAYRNKLSLPVGGKIGDVKIGMYKQNTHEIVEVKHCLLTDDWAKKLIEIVKNYLDENGIEPYNQADFSGEIRHVTARHIDGQLLVSLVSNGEFRHNTAPLVASLKKNFPIFGLFVNQNTKKNNVILGEKTIHIFGINEIKSSHNFCDFTSKNFGKSKQGFDTNLNQNFGQNGQATTVEMPIQQAKDFAADAEISFLAAQQDLLGTGSQNFDTIHFTLRPDSFFQVNDEVKNQIYETAKRLLDTAKIDALIDCFSGVGLLTSAVASNDFDTYAIEIEPSAVDDANQLVKLNNLTRVTNICGDVNVELPKLYQKLSNKTTALIVDPPRKGLGETICNTILNNPPNQIIYISCDPATLARDLKLLTQKFTPTHIQPFDMFPQTRHVETLICLQRKPLN